MELKRRNSRTELEQLSIVRVNPLVVMRDRPSGVKARGPRKISVDTFFARVLAGSLLISLPAIVILGALMFAQELRSSTDAASVQSEATAVAAAGRISQWVREPAGYVAQLARESIVPVGHPGPSAIPLKTAVNASFDAIEVLDSSGAVIAATASDPDLQAIGSAVWFGEVLYSPTLLPIGKGKVGLNWMVTAPIVGLDGISQGAVVGDLNITALSALLGATTGAQESHVVNSDHLLVFSTDWRPLTTDVGLAAKGALSVKAEVGLVDKALSTGSGSLRLTDYRNHDVFAGYGAASGLGLVVISGTDSAAALAPAYSLGRLTLAIMVVGALLIVALAIVLARFTIRPITTLSGVAERAEAGDLTGRVRLAGGREMRVLGTAFNNLLVRLKR